VREAGVLRSGGLEEVDLVMRGEVNGFCRRGRILLRSVGNSGAGMVVLEWLINKVDGVMQLCGTCPR
jgi:hypothetical protein